MTGATRTLARVKSAALMTALLAISGAGTASASTAAASPDAATYVYIGTHGGKGPDEGIFAARLDEKTGAITGLGLAANVERPTWQAVDPRRPILYTVSETGNDGKASGAVYSFAIDAATGKLRPLGRSDSGGGGATHLAYDPASSTLFVANFGGGQVSAIPVRPDGTFAEVSSVQTDTGSGPHRRQTGPHAHGVTVDPSGRYVLAPDLGADKIFVYRFDAATRKLLLGNPAAQPLPAGSGPRHLVFSPDGRFAFLDTELTGEVYVFRWDARAGQLTPVHHISINQPDFTGERSAAEVVVSRDGRFLYVSDRGANSLIVYAIDAQSGRLAERQRISGGGDRPWSFAISPSGRWMLVTNEGSSALAEFSIDRRSGRLAATANTLAVPKPVSLSFFVRRQGK